MKNNKLCRGDIIDIVAPASQTSKFQFKDTIALIEGMGYTPRFSKTILKSHSFYASSTTDSYNDLKKALLAKDSKAVWCLRGGWGSQRLIPHLMRLRRPRRSKIFMGFSDITSLHLFLTQNWNWTTYHGPNAYDLANDSLSKSFKQCFDLLCGKKENVIFKNLKPISNVELKGKVLAKVNGGNLTVLSSNAGSANQLKNRSQFLFLEDVGERGYRVDRNLVQLIQAKCISKKLKAVFLGDFTNCFDPNGIDYTLKAFKQLSEALQLPIYRGVKAGHGIPNNTIPFNSKAEFKNNTLIISSDIK